LDFLEAAASGGSLRRSTGREPDAPRRATLRPVEGASIRPGRESDLPDLVAIYNHYVLHTPITFDLEPYTLDTRRPWLAQFFAGDPRHRLFVAEHDGRVIGWADSHQFRAKAAYDPSVESSVYLDPAVHGRGLGARLYQTLFDALVGHDVHLIMAGITLPNDASIALHRRFGFQSCGVMREVGRKHGRYWDVEWLQRMA
jgi:phosphinothricin acetyltransferase